MVQPRHVLDLPAVYLARSNQLLADAIGQLGDAGRNILSGPPERDWDFSLVKDTKLGFLGEAGMLEFRAEFFNILNHTNFSGDGLRTNVFNGDSSILTPFAEPGRAQAWSKNSWRTTNGRSSLP